MERVVLDAIILQKNGKIEVRCRNCGKLLFKIENILNIRIDNAENYARIISRCTRNSCKQDNRVFLNVSA